MQDSEDAVTFKLNQADIAAAKLTKANDIGLATQAGLSAWESTVTVDDPDGDLTAGLDLINDSDLPAEDKPAAETALKTMVTNRRAEAKIQLEQLQDKQLGDINKLTFVDKDYQAATTSVINSNLDEGAKTSLLQTISTRARAAASGREIVNNRVEENRLYEEALGIWKGGSKRDFDADLAKNSGELDDAAYQRVSQTASTTLKTSQAQDLSRANIEASRQLVDFQSEDAWDKFLADSIKGLSPKASDAFTNKANEIRQAQFRELSNFNAELRDWIAVNPDKTGKDFFVFSRGLENQYRLAKQSDTTIEQIRDEELSKELNEIPPLETIIMISPDGKRFNVPLDKVQKFTDNGFTGI